MVIIMPVKLHRDTKYQQSSHTVMFQEYQVAAAVLYLCEVQCEEEVFVFRTACTEFSVKAVFLLRLPLPVTRQLLDEIVSEEEEISDCSTKVY